MIDTRAVGQELQEQLAGAARRGQEQAKKAQVQVRKGQEVVTEVIKTVTLTAEAFRPQLPTIKLPSLSRPPLSRLPGASTVMTSAQEMAEQLVATQRRLTDQVTRSARPWFAQGAARFNQAAQTILPAGTFGPASETAKHADPLGVTETSETSGTSETTATAGGRKGTEARKTVPRRSSVSTARKPSTAKTSTAKPSTAKTSTAKASAPKAGPAKASTAKASTPKAGQEKASTRKNGTGRTKPDTAKD